MGVKCLGDPEMKQQRDKTEFCKEFMEQNLSLKNDNR
jgi:hypothetical protein